MWCLCFFIAVAGCPLGVAMIDSRSFSQLPHEKVMVGRRSFPFWDGKNFSGRLLNFQKPLFYGFLSYLTHAIRKD